MARKLKVFVTVDGTQYGPDDTVPAEVAKKIDNPDVWDEDAKSSSSSSGSSK
jgi:hypothetical protein